MKNLFIVSALALAGCSSAPPAPSYVEVKVPMAVPCKTADVARPAFAVDQLPIGAPIDMQMRALRAERHQRIGYELELLAANEACK
ncbi:hypothetical protein GST45_21410 [Serratia marcescens]|jgi:uncharacterized lipoprotein YmbA|uniref:Lipoprotein n=1 Tax=Serratia marcescens TaxID=615 RepID=A0ABD5BSD4_SERMA|nr:hypothetical protein [Serratia marcescens]DAL33649.1 MAG TPA_asm: TRAF PROTEIN, TRAO PROTEIN, TRAN ADHESION, BACTERIAL SECRETION.5A [Caudoviricetes sp.]MCZ6928719.1 hypothetical protein [Serratia marcescens]MDE5234375.1 hypothetical protein [Serratia marcescens]MDE5257458.1 hypothetical protein [Serratia marcescens]MDQ9400856.1 hypothetical protein [Serratia marcescens]